MSDIQISIIDVNLGVAVTDIINSRIVEMTEQNRQQIAAAVETAKETAAMVAKRTNADQEVTVALEAVYQELTTKTAAGLIVPSDAILLMVAPHITNMISFVGKMRNWLTGHRHPYKLKPARQKSVAGYKLVPIGAGDAAEGDAAGGDAATQTSPPHEPPTP